MEKTHNPDESGERINSALIQSKKAGAINIVSTGVPIEELQRHINLDLVDLVMTSSTDETYGDPKMMGHTVVLRYGTRGMSIGTISLELDDANRITSYRHKVFKLTKSIPDATSTTAWYTDYSNEVKANYHLLAEKRKVLESGNNVFAGAKQCAACHATAHDVWRKTKHAKAFSALEAVNKHFDPDCIVCHVVGFNKPGGFIDLSVSGFLTDVQCESCHGAARTHVESGGRRKTPNSDWFPVQMCLQCHVGDHSPDFNFESYWKAIAHGKE
jgi:hypothetical protein